MNNTTEKTERKNKYRFSDRSEIKSFFKSCGSVFALYARASMVKLLILLILIAVLQTEAFYVLSKNCLRLDEAFIASERVSAIIAAAGYMLFVFVTDRSVIGKSTKTVYTMKRLKIGEWTSLAVHTLYCILMLLVFWGVQVLVILTEYKLFTAGTTGASGFRDIDLFMITYRSKLLHGFLPLDDTTLLLRNITAIVFQALAISERHLIASYSYRKKLDLVYTTALWIVLTFPSAIGGDMQNLLGYFIILSSSVAGIAVAISRTSGDENEVPQ